MIYEQYKIAIKEGYRNQTDLGDYAEAAKTYRKWLEALDISPDLRNGLIEPIQVIEDTFRELISNPGS